MSIEKLNLMIEEMEFVRFKNLISQLDFDELKTLKIDLFDLWNESSNVECLKKSNFIDLELGVRQGLWEDWNKKEPIPFPTFVDLEEMLKQNVKFMSQLLVRLEIFSSVSEARKAGWIMPIEVGDFMVKFNKFQKIRLVIE